MNHSKKYLSLKSAKANKIGQRSQGFIEYRILTDQTLKQLYIIITGNDDGGYYSKEIVPFEKIEQSLEGIKPDIAIPSKLFKKAFIGKSNNNHAFMAAILRNEKLIAPMNDAVRKHSIQPGWDRWKIEMLKNANKAIITNCVLLCHRQPPIVICPCCIGYFRWRSSGDIVKRTLLQG